MCVLGKGRKTKTEFEEGVYFGKKGGFRSIKPGLQSQPFFFFSVFRMMERGAVLGMGLVDIYL